MGQSIRKKMKNILSFLQLDFLAGGLKASPAAWKSFMGKKYFDILDQKEFRILELKNP
jgi:hypothetical protein